jgi:cell wall-associated NlpC family hydrolase
VLRGLVVCVSLALASLGLVGVASAATVQPTITRAVSGSVPAGHQLAMTASVHIAHAGRHSVRGLRVDLFRIVPSGRQLVTSATTDAAGSVSALVTPTATGRWYWRFAGTKSLAPSGTRVTVAVTKPAAAPLGARAVAEAARHLGAPYVYGATGPNAFDCSGFTRYVFGRLGVSLPRTAAEQYDAVRHVAVADRQPGDLIFFRLGSGGVDHVGIYAGNDQVIVAPKAGDHVRYEAIWTSYEVGRVG